MFLSLRTHNPHLRLARALLLALAASTLGLSAQTDTNALKLRFNFDAAPAGNVIVDQLGRHPGTVDGAQWVASESGRSGVMKFALATVPQITIMPTPDFDGPAGTIAFWMKSGPASGPGNDGAILFDRRASEGDVIVLLNGGQLFVQGKGASYATKKTVDDDQWHHVAYVFDQSAAGSVSLYIDGVLDTAANNSQEWYWSPEQTIELGRSHDGYWRRYHGSLDDFLWYNRLFTPEQVAALAAGTVSTDGLVTRLNFSAAPAGDVLADSSPSGLNPGTNLGAQWAETVAGRTGVMQFIATPDNVITVPPQAELDAPTTSISFWMKSIGAEGPGNEGSILFDRRSGAGDVIVLNNNGNLFVQATAGPGQVANSFATQAFLSDDQWHHVLYVADQSATGQIQIFVDGVLDTAQPNNRAWSWDPARPLALGKSADAYWKKFTGFLDDFQVYGEALTDTQAQRVFTQGVILPDPLITQHPQGALVPPGTAVTLSVTATGTGSLSYQWQKDGADLAGKTSASLAIPSVALADSGVYRAVVKSTVGTSISLEATLTVGLLPELTLNLYPGLLMTGTVGLHYRVEYAEAVSPNQWQTLTNITALPVSPFFALDPQAATYPARFYRALLVP